MVWDASELVGGRRNRVHGLNVEDGVASMFSAQVDGIEEPWHGLGQRLDHVATWLEAREAARLGWRVGLTPLVTQDTQTLVTHRAVVREDTGAILGVVGPAYKPIQNDDCFAFLDRLAGEHRVEYHAAGALGKGERVWLLAKIPGIIRIGQSDDIIEKYLLLSNSHDAKSSMRGLWTPTRVVCRNTCALALAEGAGQGVTIRHNGEINAKVAEAQRVLGLAERFYDELPPLLDALAAYRPSVKQVNAYFEALYPDPEDPETHERAAKTAAQTRETLLGLFDGGVGADMPTANGTTWGLYNSVTQYLDHNKAPRGQTEGARSRKLEALWFGHMADLKRDAWAMACDLAGVN